MGSQTLEILRQGVWASLTGGWFYDPHQSVFCNIVHLYLWLFLLCTPFVAYLYFPGTWLTWCIYSILTSLTVLLLKVANMALHRLYDRAQSMSEANIKQHFFKVTKETSAERNRDNEPGIEMKVIHEDGEVATDDMVASVEKAINEISAENSMVSIENGNSIIDLKVDVHRKNSSESIELMFYAPSMISGNSQQDQQSLVGATSNSKSIRSSHTINNSSISTSNNNNNNNTSSTPINDPQAKYISVYPKDNSPVASSYASNSLVASGGGATALASGGPRPPHLVRKSSEIVRGSHQRRRLERQSSLDAAAESAIVAKLIQRQVSEASKTSTSGGGGAAGNAEKCDSFVHAQVSKSGSVTQPTAFSTTGAQQSHQQAQRSNTTSSTLSVIPASNSNATTSALKTSRLQRHRSSETHDERLKQQQRSGGTIAGSSIGTSGHSGGGGVFLSIHHEHGRHHPHHRHHHHTHRRGGSGGGAPMASSSGSVAVLASSSIGASESFDVDDMELGLGGSANIVTHGSHLSSDGRMRALPSWILGSSSDVFIEDDSFTKSDLGIEQLDDRSTANSSRAALLNSHPHSNQYRLNHHSQTSSGRANISKDPIYTISALQLHKRPRREGAIKRRRHSNATTLFKTPNDSSSNVGQLPSSTTTVRRIKSTALEVACPRPSVSNLCPHPNSVEAINGQQQIKNPQNSLLPPPSKCLVRNPHLNLCPKFGGSFGGSSTNSSLDFGSTNALIDPVNEGRDKMKQENKPKKDTDLSVTDSVENDENPIELTLDEDDASMGAVGGVCPHHFLHSHHQHHSQPQQHHHHSHHHSAESDVGQILNDTKDNDDDGEEDEDDGDDDDDEGDEDDENEVEDEESIDPRHDTTESNEDDDDDEFKDFDYNVEHILEVLEHTHNQLDDDLRAQQQLQKQEQQLQLQSQQKIAQGLSEINKRNKPDKPPVRSTSHETRHDTVDGDDGEEDDDDDDDNDGALTMTRERLHSTDSETDNNGSRSPLLNNKKWAVTSSSSTSNSNKEKTSEKALRDEIKNVQKQKHSIKKHQASIQALSNPDGEVQPPAVAASNTVPQAFPPAAVIHNQQHQQPKGNEVDSGCPSSDCEQISASSKDVLLNISNEKVHQEKPSKSRDDFQDNVPTTTNANNGASSSSSNSNANVGKRLGAIPKLVQYREIDERSGGQDNHQNPSCSHHSYKRHAGNWSSVAPTQSNHAFASVAAGLKAISRTSSSSNSSHSVSAESFTADIQKMLWLMHGGSVDDRGRPIENPGNLTSLPTSVSSGTQGNMSSAHLQFYQDALKALNSASSAERLALTERLYHREQLLRRSMRQRSAGDAESTHRNAIEQWPLDSNAAMSHIMSASSSSAAAAAAASRTAAPLTQVMIDSPSSSTVLNNRNVSSATTVSLKGFIHEFINDELRNMETSQRIQATPLTTTNNRAAMAAILNVDGAHIDNYCDYWRPACMLTSDKPAITPKSFYKYRLKLGSYTQEFNISMDRLELMALFDRDIHWIHILLSVVLSAAVAYLGSSILQLSYYKDVFAFLFCAVIAGSQYSLLKSVQPDAASPIHGFNKTVAYSRAIYFCICSSLLLFFQNLKEEYDVEALQGGEMKQWVFFGVSFYPAQVNSLVLQALYIFLLSFPLIFSLGLFPQINTFTMYLMEQIDMHVFGGNAAGSLMGSVLCVLRSILGVMLLYGPLYAALNEGKGTQHIIFSIFCALLVPLGYHLSRSASDFSHIWALMKHCIMSTYHEDDDELSTASTQKLTAGKTKRGSSKKREREKQGVGGGEKSKPGENIEMSSLEKLQNGTTPRNETTEELEEADAEAGEEEEEETETNELSEDKDPMTEKRSKSKASSLGSSTQTLGKTTMSTSKKAITASSSSCNTNLETENIMKEVEEEVTPSSLQLPPVIRESKETELVATTTTTTTAAAAAAGTTAKETDLDKMSTTSTTNPAEISTYTGVIHNEGEANENDVFTMNCPDNANSETESNSADPLPKKLQHTVYTRLKNDFVVTVFLAVVVLGLHCSTVFTVLQPDLNVVLYGFTGALGFLLHYIIPQMRKHMPWLCFAKPLLKQKEYGRYEVSNAPKIMWFEKFYIYLCLIERNVLFPLLVISALTADATVIAVKYGIAWGSVIVAVCALKFIRNAYSDPTNQYLIVMFTVLFFRVDFAMASETFLIDYFFVSLAFRKCCDFFLKLQFIVTYIAPWQITWGSAFHAFAQPFSVPHSAMLFLQAGISSLLSTPLNPFLGSAIFLTSYVRPIKFWERDYNTRRIDHSNTRLSSQLERDLGADDNNLNSIFYEHLTRSLQHSLCGDLIMGRWGNVNQGDCFVLASDYLNCLVHIIELGNGLCTFQMRGLEFRGTYCQQREVEAITEDVEDNEGCCCCDPGHLPRMLSANAMFSTRWLAWQVVASQYVVEGYSISDNLASTTLQVFEYRKVLITYYVKSIIYYVIKNPKLDEWLSSTVIQEALQHTLSRQFVDLDPIFNFNLDEDFDFRAVGITRMSFCYVYLSWLNYCYDKRKESLNPTPTASSGPNQNPTPTASQAGITTQQPTAAVSTSTIASTPNLSTAQQKSQSQQQLRIRPQKSATMSGSNEVVVNSVEQMATSHSLANISRQASESAPGLTSTSTPLTRSSKSAPSGSKHSYQKSDCSPSARPEGRAASAEPSRGSSSEKPPPIKLKVPSIAKDSPIVSLCLALSLLARRSLATASHSSMTGVEFFLHGLHALFKGDFRITSPRDEWVFADMDLLHAVVAPAVKMALKLQQDHISNPDEFRDPDVLYEAIDTSAKDLVISHEADPVWRSAVLRGAPNLLALRHVMEDGSDEYRIIRLTKRFLTFRVIKLNRECVRGLWAGQQQELIYLRNRNPERGSIQNAKQALRNIINSSCDQPIGYPIYVSPLTTSYADTNDQLKKVVGGPITPEAIKTNILDWWHHIREKCRQGCSSGSSMETTTHLGLPSGACSNSGESGDLRPMYISPPIYNTLTASTMFSRATAATGVPGATLSSQFGSDGLSSMRSSMNVMKPSSTTLLAGLLNREQEILRESRTNKQLLSSSSVRSSSERERRATLPIASTSSVLPEVIKDSDDSSQTLDKDVSSDNMAGAAGSLVAGVNNTVNSGSPRYTKIYCSSGNLGIGNIITTPGDYPRKTKGPICLTAAAAGVGSMNCAGTTTSTENGLTLAGGSAMGAEQQGATTTGSGASFSRVSTSEVAQPRFALYEKVIIVDEREIFHNIDQCRRIVWPFEALRQKGGRLSWDGWEPRAGMVGYVIHIWRPNHPNKVCRTPLNRDVYLIEIGENYVPVTASGLRQYNQAMDSVQKEMETSRRNSLQREMAELRQQQVDRGLTPILGSSLESPTSLLAEGTRGGSGSGKSGGGGIQAVSSSSSEDESCLMNLEKQRQEEYLKQLWQQEKDVAPVAAGDSRKIEAVENDVSSPNEEKSSLQEESKLSETTSGDKDSINEEISLEKLTTSSSQNSNISNSCTAKDLVEHLVDAICDTVVSEQIGIEELAKSIDERGEEQDSSENEFETNNKDNESELTLVSNTDSIAKECEATDEDTSKAAAAAAGKPKESTYV